MIFGLSNAEGAAALSGVASLVGSGISGHEQRKAIREQGKQNMELAQYQFDKNLEMWNLQNQYNTPAAQMQRFRDAGLNPNLIYSQGSSGNASGMPEFHAPQANIDTSKADTINNVANAVTNTISQLLSLKQQEKQNQLLEEQVRAQKLANVKSSTENSYMDAYLSQRNEYQRMMYLTGLNGLEVAAATKPTIISSMWDDNSYKAWHNNWMRGFLPREEQRTIAAQDMSFKRTLQDIARSAWDIQKDKVLLPYQTNMLQEQINMAGLKYAREKDLFEHPWKALEVFGIPIGTLIGTLDDLFPSWKSYLPWNNFKPKRSYNPFGSGFGGGMR